MFTRLRRFAGVLLALSLLPAAAGSAQCADHGDAGSAEISASSESEVHAAHAHHVVKSVSEHAAPGTETAEAQPSEVQPSKVQPSAAHLLLPDSPHVIPDSCCPPAGIPGDCASAMGCSVMSATPEQRAAAPLHVIDRVIVADGAVHAPGPSRAPEVPPPRR